MERHCPSWPLDRSRRRAFDLGSIATTIRLASWETPDPSRTAAEAELGAGGGAIQDRLGLEVGELFLQLVAGCVGEGGVVEVGEARAGVGGAFEGVGRGH